MVKDLYINYFKKEDPEALGANPEERRGIQKLSYITTGIIGIIVLGAAFNPPDLIVWLNLFAFGGLQAAFLWPLVLGLYWKRANGSGALVSMLTGVGLYIYFAGWLKRVAGMHVIVPVLAITLIVFIGVSLFTQKPKEKIIDLFWGE